MKKFNQFINESYQSDLKDLVNKSFYFDDTFTRIEFIREYAGNGYIVKNPYYRKGGINDKKIFKKSAINDFGYSSNISLVTLNHKGKPVSQLLYVTNDYGRSRSTLTKMIGAYEISLLSKIAFDGNNDRAIDFYNKKFLSAKKLEINKNIMLPELSEFDDMNINQILSTRPKFKISDDNLIEFSKLHFVKDRKPNPKSSKEIKIREKLDYYITGIEKYLYEELKYEGEETAFPVFKIPKKSNPIRVSIGIDREQFSNRNYSILTYKFFNKYKYYVDKLNKIYNEFEKVSSKSKRNTSESTDQMNFIIDVFKIPNDSDFATKIGSYSNVKKFNLF